MHSLGRVELSTTPLARRTLLTTTCLGLVGSLLGTFVAARGIVAGQEFGLVLSCALFSSGVLFTLLVFRNVSVQTVANVSTVYYALYLCTGAIVTVASPGHHLDLFVYLVWFYPLLVYNKLVNAPTTGRFLAKSLIAAPLVLVACLSPRILASFTSAQLAILGAFCLCYLAYALAFDTVMRYREDYVVGRERAESRKAASELLESISDCFISLDREFRLTYANEAAWGEFGAKRRSAVGTALAEAAPGFLSESMLAGFRNAYAKTAASAFEAKAEQPERWYDVRCFPRPDGMSVYFRNIGEAIAARRKLDEAQRGLRDQAELLDHAQDAIFVADMDDRIVYWNKGAERVYGWTAAEVAGQSVADVFHAARESMTAGLAAALKDGEWSGDLARCRRDGSASIVESCFTLVRRDDGRPRAVLAVGTDVTERKAAEAKTEHLAFYDALTELPNRAMLRKRLEEALAASPSQSPCGALLLIDLDHFKTANETLGQEIGDLLLKQVAVRLEDCARTGDTVARLGGDEFAMLQQGLETDPSAAGARAEAACAAIRAAFAAPYHVGAFEHNVSVCVGVVLFGGGPESVGEVLKRADLALHRAKAEGRNRVRFFDPEMQELVDARAALEFDLRRALQKGEFELHYQPQMDASGLALGAEALLRWPHPTRGLVPPDEFIPLAEEGGMIVELGRWVLETACSQLAAWAAQPGMQRLSVSVNVSLLQVLDSNFVHAVLEALRAAGADPHRLKLEITESTVMGDADDTIAKMTALRARGVGFSLDDFGIGYSSLSHLKRLPLDELKVDRTFVNDVLTDERDASIVRTIVALGQDLNLSVIAEGVETEGQRAFLEREGCRAYQGFLFSPALPRAKFEAFVAAAAARNATAGAA